MNTAEIKDVLDILSEAGSARVREQLMVVLAQERESLAEKLGNVDRMILALNGQRCRAATNLHCSPLRWDWKYWSEPKRTCASRH